MDKDLGRPAVIVASWRCGGTFLSECLSNHPDIFCVRGEPMHRHNIWRQSMATPEDVLRCVFEQRHYQVTMCKLTYTQAFHAGVWPVLTRMRPRVIWLYRENVLRQAISLIKVKLHRKGRMATPVHSTEDCPLETLAVEPRVVVEHARSLAAANEDARQRLAGWELLELTYSQVVGGENGMAERLSPVQARRICKFLDVPYKPMAAGLRRVNPYPLSALLGNWPEVAAAVRETELARFLDEEAALWPPS